MNDRDATALYLDVVHPLNEELKQIRERMSENDTRCIYLLNFETTLSASLLDHPLYDDKNYKGFLEKNKPLPKDEYEFLDYETFRAWIHVYEMVMRDHNLIGMTRKATQIGGLINSFMKAGES